MFERLEEIENKFNEFNEQLMSEEVLKNIKLSFEISKKQAALRDVVEEYQNYKSVKKDLDEAESMIDDPELGEFIKDEITTLKQKERDIVSNIELLLLPKDENDDRNIIMEIRGAAGGDEANIFAGDLYRMYCRYAESVGWKTEIVSSVDCASGGFTQIEFLIKGENVYSKLKYESGSHRVQRVPATESQGRIHTSTATVAVIPEAEELEIEVLEKDIKIDVFRSGGAGGQSVNTTDSAVRMTHMPTGLIVNCQNERSQVKNKAAALKILKSRILEFETKKKNEAEGIIRKSKVGNGDRSEKIRTYNYPQNRLTDHRIGFSSMQLDRVMEGALEPTLNALFIEEQRRQLQGS